MKYFVLAIVVMLSGCGFKPPEVNACFKRLQPTLVDPKTATIEDYEVDVTVGNKVKLAVRAANRMGGFGMLYVTCGPFTQMKTFTAEERGKWLLS